MLKGCVVGTKKRVLTLRKVRVQASAGEGWAVALHEQMHHVENTTTSKCWAGRLVGSLMQSCRGHVAYKRGAQ